MLTGLLFNVQTRERWSRGRLKARSEVLFLGHSGFHTTDEATPPALADLFVNELSAEISRLIKRQKRGWEAIILTELVTIAEHFERTLDQDYKPEVCQTNGHTDTTVPGPEIKITPGPPTSHPLGAHHQKSVPGANVSFVINRGPREKIVPKGPMQIPQCPQARAPGWVPSKTDGALRDLLLNTIRNTLKQPWETTIKVNGKPCQILLATGATLNPTLIGQHLPGNKRKVSIVGVSSKVQREFLSQSETQMTLGAFQRTASFSAVW